MIDIYALGTAIKNHLTDSLSSTTYYVTQDIDSALSQKNIPVSVLVLFSGFSHREELSLSPNEPTRDYEFIIGLAANKESTEAMDEALDDAIMTIAPYLTAPGHGWPPFATSDVERAIVTSAGPKTLTDRGLATQMTLEVRVMEDS